MTRPRVVAIDPDIVLLHNTPAARCKSLADVPLTIQYVHSRISPASANVTVACSAWLRSQFGADSIDGVLYQPVDLAHNHDFNETRSLRDRVIVGRLCTPTARKWPSDLIPFYANLARRHSDIDWEFVGCPESMIAPLRQVCAGRAQFLPAEWTARRHLLRWDALLYHHPTLTETFGRTVAEAMLSGCIPIVDVRGGFREQVSPDTGFLCNGPDEFNTALDRIRDRSHRRVLSIAAREVGRKRFSGKAFALRLRHLVNAAIELRG